MIHVSNTWDKNKLQSEEKILSDLIATADLSDADRDTIVDQATHLIDAIRTQSKPGLMEVFLAEYGLSTDEGVALMCLAEALLRVPDKITVDALIDDKITPAEWAEHLGQSPSTLVNASSLGLLFSSKVLGGKNAQVAKTLRTLIQRVGEPVIRAAVTQAIRQMGDQFVLGETIESAQKRAKKLESQGYTYSYDMLGEAAITQDDAERYIKEYSNAIDAIAQNTSGDDVTLNPGISVKLSALHPRYELAQADRVLKDIVPVLQNLAQKAAQAGIGLNVDAEEADRLGISMDIISATLAHSDLTNWDGFGVVVQAYSKRALQTIDALYALAKQHNRKIMVRLVKGAYWDSEIKHSQVQGLTSFPVFTRKEASDVSYIANASKLLQINDFIYPQFATHNAHSISAILHMAQQTPNCRFEFQRLHGMGEAVHDIVAKKFKTNCRIYAPVGPHKDLLAYLVRRLLENGANSSFVNQLINKAVSAKVIAADPFRAVMCTPPPSKLVPPPNIYGESRKNSTGYDLSDNQTLLDIFTQREVQLPPAAPITYSQPSGTSRQVFNPATTEVIGSVLESDEETVSRAIANAQTWSASVDERIKVLQKAADLYEQNAGLFFAVLAKEAGKTIPDAVGELREAVDFLRYYAQEAETSVTEPRGIFTAISPWNFPLAIFTGQIAAALVCGNGVLAKPAEQTSITASIAVRLMHQAGVPVASLQLLLGSGSKVGSALTRDHRVSGVVFTGSTETAMEIRRNMARFLPSNAPLIAETGGINAMIIDSTALPEQAVRDVIASAFQSAGQRCSALRCLYVQEDVADDIVNMIIGAMNELTIGYPWQINTDVGPVIDEHAKAQIADYISEARSFGRVLPSLRSNDHGFFIPPTLVGVESINDLDREVFGPVLHVATFKSEDLDEVINTINARGYGLTFGLHTRIDSRVQKVSEHIHVGNIYVNRNQIGAVVGTQPFGGEGLSGTGPKAGGPNYLRRFLNRPAKHSEETWQYPCDLDALRKFLSQQLDQKQIRLDEMPGPTGETNHLRSIQKGPILCLGPGEKTTQEQVERIVELGGIAIGINGFLKPKELITLDHISGVVWWGDDAREYLIALAHRTGPIIPLITEDPDLSAVIFERHLCIDTTAAGGNTTLLSG